MDHHNQKNVKKAQNFTRIMFPSKRKHSRGCCADSFTFKQYSLFEASQMS